jgi:cobalt-zinc-cadmium efflux system membrane fusion protein
MRRPSLPPPFDNRLALLGAAAVAVMAILAAGAYAVLHARSASAAEAAAAAAGPTSGAAQSVQLTDSQLDSIKVGRVVDHDFPIQHDAVGSIDFNEDLNVQVFSPYQGRIIQTFADIGDEVQKGQTLFTIESPDFIAAESNLISAAGVLQQTDSALERARKLYAVQGIDQNDYETAVANQQTAEGDLRAARNAVAIFGRTEAQIDRIVAMRQVETALIVRSPITGRVTARNAAPGLLEQPGNPPAPYAVSDLSTMWMLADVIEADSPDFKVGQAVTVSVFAFPGRVFSGKVTRIGATVDPNSRRVTIRSEIRDPRHELRPGMFASFVIQTGAPLRAPAVPLDGVVREGDGTMSVWVASADRHRFTRRIVSVGLQIDGFDQILSGVQPGEMVATEGAILLSNMLFGGAS